MSRATKLVWRLAWLSLAGATLILVAGSASTFRLLGGAVLRCNWVVALPILPIQLVATALNAVSLRLLRPGPPWLACMGSRWLRDAGGNLIVFAPGIGEIAGARLLVLAGGASPAVIGASGLDVPAETIAQIPFGVLALVAAPGLWSLASVSVPTLGGLPGLALLAGLSLLGLLVALRWADAQAVIAGLQRHFAHLSEAVHERRTALPAAAGLHLLAWASGGFQVYFAALAVGGRLSLGSAFVAESFAYAVRGLFFVVPAGVAVQEASFVAVGLVFGLTAEQGLGVSLLLRARDFVFGAPALMLWTAAEMRGRHLLTPKSLNQSAAN